ncbi:MAG: HNH endonuclease [Oscillospiraceae bacterium]|nr:HNH endonuclease [Oscillospiraceae bacterium]
MVRIYKHRTPPASLETEKEKKSGKYNLPDVSRQLVRDEADKCYICEISVASGFQVEHRIGHNGGEHTDLKFSWDNLHQSCPHCNSVKNQKKYATGLLDCCKTDPEQEVCQRIRMAAITVTPRTDTEAAATTADLIRECLFSTSTFQKAHNSAFRRREIKLRTISLCKKLRRYRDLRDTRDPEDPDRREAFREVCGMISSKAEFSAFLRTFVRDRLDEFPEFTEYVGAWTEQNTEAQAASATGVQE